MSEERFVSRYIQNENARRKWREDRDSAEKMLAARRERYKQDPAYREAIKDAVKRRRAAHAAAEPRRRNFNRDRVICVDGHPVLLYSAGKTATAFGITRRRLDYWVNRRIIPTNYSVDNHRRKWFPREFVEFVSEFALKKYEDESLSNWSVRVKDAWNLRQLGSNPIVVVSQAPGGDRD